MYLVRIILIGLFLFTDGFILGQDITMGLILNSPNAYNGYTLFGNNEFTYLIDNCGRKVNTWESDYKAGESMYLLHSGALLRAGKVNGDFNAGGRGGVFELFNWEGDLLWQYRIADSKRHAHHDLALLPNGNFLCLVWEEKSQSECKLKGRERSGSVWSERILEIEIIGDNQANIVWEWSVWDHLIQDHDPNANDFGVVADRPELLNINYLGENDGNEKDWLHFNSISYNEELDQIVLSSRNLSELYVIDHSTTTEEAASHSGGLYGRGGDILFRYGNPQVYGQGGIDDRSLFKQHHVDWTEHTGEHSGAFSIFNNDYIEDRQSSALIINNPVDKDGHYIYSSNNGFGSDTIIRLYSDISLYSDILSSCQVLPNGNLLIVEGKSGHMIEVDENDEIVWEYINPVNYNGGPGIQGGTPRFNSLFKAIRYNPNYAGFDGRELVPGETIELSSFESPCEIFDQVVGVPHLEDEEELNQLKLGENPVHDELIIDYAGFLQLEGYVFNVQGQMVKTIQLKHGMNFINIDMLDINLYFLWVSDSIIKFVKK